MENKVAGRARGALLEEAHPCFAAILRKCLWHLFPSHYILDWVFPRQSACASHLHCKFQGNRGLVFMTFLPSSCPSLLSFRRLFEKYPRGLRLRPLPSPGPRPSLSSSRTASGLAVTCFSPLFCFFLPPQANGSSSKSSVNWMDANSWPSTPSSQKPLLMGKALLPLLISHGEKGL